MLEKITISSMKTCESLGSCLFEIRYVVYFFFVYSSKLFLIMSNKSVIWCSHPKHDEILPNGKKHYWKTGTKPSHPKRKRTIKEDLAEYINNHHERILNESSKRLVEGNYLCSTCFANEERNFNLYEEMGTNVDNGQDYVSCGLDNELNSPIDHNYVHAKQDDAKMKLNQVFQYVNVQMIDDMSVSCIAFKLYKILFCSRNTNQISHAIDATYLRLNEWSNILLPSSRRAEKPETFSSLDLSMDDAVWILQHLRELFIISSHEEQQRILTMLPSTWGRDRISQWFNSSEHQARHSIALRSNTGIFSYAEDHRVNKSLDSEIGLMVHNFYISDEISRETSYKKQVIHPPPSRDPIPLRFLHLTIGEIFEQFKTKHPTVTIGRSKFFSLRPVWVRERTPHDDCLCLYHANAVLLLQASVSPSLMSFESLNL